MKKNPVNVLRSRGSSFQQAYNDLYETECAQAQLPRTEKYVDYDSLRLGLMNESVTIFGFRDLWDTKMIDSSLIRKSLKKKQHRSDHLAGMAFMVLDIFPHEYEHKNKLIELMNLLTSILNKWCKITLQPLIRNNMKYYILDIPEYI